MSEIFPHLRVGTPCTVCPSFGPSCFRSVSLPKKSPASRKQTPSRKRPLTPEPLPIRVMRRASPSRQVKSEEADTPTPSRTSSRRQNLDNQVWNPYPIEAQMWLTGHSDWIACYYGIAFELSQQNFPEFRSPIVLLIRSRRARLKNRIPVHPLARR